MFTHLPTHGWMKPGLSSSMWFDGWERTNSRAQPGENGEPMGLRILSWGYQGLVRV